MANKRRTQKTKQWALKHINDTFVKKAQGQGYRSRAVYKLEEIDKQDKLIKPNFRIADLGSAPGGWSQYILRQKKNNTVIAIDLLEMGQLDGVDFIQGDFSDPDVIEKMMAINDGEKFDLVISDMAPNITGIRDVDEARFDDLLESVRYFCDQFLKPKGNLLVKLFEGHAANQHRAATKKTFDKNIVRKPLASRANSKELYLLSLNKR